MHSKQKHFAEAYSVLCPPNILRIEGTGIRKKGKEHLWNAYILPKFTFYKIKIY